MISSNFSLWLFLLLIVYIYSEFFLQTIITTIFKNLKNLTISFTKKNNFIFFKTSNQVLIINLLLLFFISYKTSSINVFFSLIIIFSYINKFFTKFNKDYIFLLNFSLLMFIPLFFFVNNYIIFYLFIELYAILFYFFFLNVNFNSKTLYLIQYKNSLLMYLFNNFLTSMLYLFGLTYIISIFGTLNFIELKYLSNINITWQMYLLVLSFIIKLSLPGYHFLKIELYKYLDVTIVIIFSVITLYINYLFTIFFFNQSTIYIIVNSYKYLSLLLLLSFFFFIHKLKINNFQEFISFSGFATNNLIILNFII